MSGDTTFITTGKPISAQAVTASSAPAANRNGGVAIPFSRSQAIASGSRTGSWQTGKLRDAWNVSIRFDFADLPVSSFEFPLYPAIRATAATARSGVGKLSTPWAWR